ncbi:MAG: hypothetical protein HYR50_09310 [Candidatus Rokubacteria bacterium]|nr:hypothetical protein [Candidatus Rokubacteria bacterium]HLF49204.1 hypothetical protein [Methylomirabilota bacterium]
MVGTPLAFARTPEELTAALAGAPDLVIIDLTTGDLTTGGWDYERFFAALDGAAPRPPVLGFTTHVLARETQPYHPRCTRVVTKETLTQELPELLKTAGIHHAPGC